MAEKVAAYIESNMPADTNKANVESGRNSGTDRSPFKCDTTPVLKRRNHESSFKQSQKTLDDYMKEAFTPSKCERKTTTIICR